jgi:hypothetical protein
MTTATLTIMALTGSLVLLKLGIMALVVVLLARSFSSDEQPFQKRTVMANLPDMIKGHH